MTRKDLLRILTVVLAGLSMFSNGCHLAHLPVDHPRLVAGVELRDVTFHSAALNRAMTYRVYLPSRMDEGQKLPVAYLLHGNGGNFREWSNHTDAVQYAAKGLILVMPEGNVSYYVNSAAVSSDKYEDYLIHDLVADVEARFPAKKDRGFRSIIGWSMGGFGAVELGLTHPDIFAFAGGLSPAIDATERRFSWRHIKLWWAFHRIFGPFGSEGRRAHDPFLLVQSADPRLVPYFYLTAGESDPLLEPNQRFVARLKQRGLAYEFHTGPGEHDWAEWNAQIPGCFESLLRRLPVAP
jgi:putative tributyrin esterase